MFYKYKKLETQAHKIWMKRKIWLMKDVKNKAPLPYHRPSLTRNLHNGR